MTRYLILLLFALVQPCWGRTYSTSFPATESPISQGSIWLNGQTDGVNWCNVQMTPGLASGACINTQDAYNDSTAILAGPWGPNQSATATVDTTTSNPSQEEGEIRLNSNVVAGTGYECDISYLPSQLYMNLVQWNGWSGGATQYTILAQNTSVYAHNGDVITCSHIGSTLMIIDNGVVEVTATDSKYTGGAPGMGFWQIGGSTSDLTKFGFSSFTATDQVGPQYALFNGSSVSTSAGTVGWLNGTLTGQSAGNIGALNGLISPKRPGGWGTPAIYYRDSLGAGTGGGTCSAGGTTCAVNVSLPANSTAIVYMLAGSVATLSGASGEAWTECTACRGGSTYYYADVAYVMKATGGESSITCTASGAVSNYFGCGVIVVSYSGSTPSYDAGNNLLAASCTACAGPALSGMTGTNDLVVQFGMPANSLTAIGAPYSSYAQFYSGTGEAAAINVASYTAPSWTQSPAGAAQLVALALRGN